MPLLQFRCPHCHQPIALDATGKCSTALIPVRPETQFHKAMLDSAAQLESPDGWPSKDDRRSNNPEFGAGFLASEVCEQIASMIRNGRRIPEEALSFSAMARLLATQPEE
jgi:hypothetical protein